MKTRIMARLLAALAAVALALAAPIPARATPVVTTIDFDTPATSPAFAPIVGPKSQGTVATIAAGAGRDGSAALRIDYSYQGIGYIEDMLKKPLKVADGAGTLHLSMWVNGAGKKDFLTGGIRLIDAKGELFQYQVTGFPQALNGTGWQHIDFDITPTGYVSTWGPNTDNLVQYPLMFLSIVSDHIGKDPTSGTVLIDDITFTSEVIPRPAITTLTADHESLVVRPGEPVTFTAAINQADTATGTLLADWKVRDMDGTVVSEVSSPVNGAQSTFTFTAKEPGWDGVECQLHDDKGDIVPASKSAVAALVTDGVPHTPGDPYLYGCCAHLLFKPVAQSDKEIAMMKSAGFGACRMDFDWGKLEPTEGTYNWTRMDDIFAKLAAAQIAPAPMVGYTARWASTGDTKSPDFRDWMMAAPAPDKYVAFLKTAVARYQGKALSWEIWNEPDLSSWRGTPDQYADLLGSAVAGAHEVDPHAIVTNGGISERYEFKTNFTPNFLAKATSHPDIFSYHSHGPLENLLVANARVREMTKGAGLQNLTLWLNEAGFSSCKGWGTERDKAETLVKKMAESEALGDKAYFLYDLRDDGNEATNPEDNYGIIAHDFSPLPAFVAVHTLMEKLCGKSPLGDLKAGGGASALAFSGQGQTAVVAWMTGRDATTNLVLRTDAKSAHLWDIMDRDTQLPIVHGSIVVPVSYEPRILTLDTSASPAILPAALDCPAVVHYAGLAGQVVLKLTNPLTEPLSGQLALTSGSADVSPASSTVALAPGETKDLAVNFNIRPGSPTRRVIRVSLSGLEGLPDLVREISLQPALAVPLATDAAAPWDGKPAVELHTPQNAVSLFAATFEDALHFHGDSDLSARVWVRGIPSGIQLHVVVTDDVQYQTSPLTELWNGDSVQFALTGPNGRSYEWIAALTATGPVIERTVWPDDVPNTGWPETVAVTRTGVTTTYDLTIPASNPDIAAALANGCNMSLLVNDNDGKGRKGWVEWTPGIGVSKDPSQYQAVVFH